MNFPILNISMISTTYILNARHELINAHTLTSMLTQTVACIPVNDDDVLEIGTTEKVSTVNCYCAYLLSTNDALQNQNDDG